MGFGFPGKADAASPTTPCRSPARSWPPPTAPPPSSSSTPAVPRSASASSGTSTSARSARPRPSAWCPAPCMVEGRRLRFAVSDNVGAYGPDGPGSPPIWAVNIHGYFAGGGMYWRESARLAEQLGWRVINPSLPGFGGSDPLDWHDVSMESLANQVMAIAHKSMPARWSCSAIRWAARSPCSSRTTTRGARSAHLPRRREHARLEGPPRRSPHAARTVPPRRGAHGRPGRRRRLRHARPLHRPDVLDLPRRAARHAPERPHRGPDAARRQHAHVVRSAQRGAPPGGPADPDPQRVGLLRPHHARAARRSSSPPSPARPVLWVPGGHSWMLARPQGQSDILMHLVPGKEFMAQVEKRWRQFTAREYTLRAVN